MQLKLLMNISELVTIASSDGRAKSGTEAMNQLSILPNAAMVFDEQIRWIGSTQEALEGLRIDLWNAVDVIDCGGKAVIPGFVDSHTHIVFTGNRTDEFVRRLHGASYLDIAAEGGGILRTMRAVRLASVAELVDASAPRVWNAIRWGTTAIEIKSGYGLNLEAELKQLRAIQQLRKEVPAEIFATFLGAHDFPPEYKSNRQAYIQLICEEMIPQVAAEGLAQFCDVFVDKGYYSPAEAEQILEAAQRYGLKIKLHADEFANTGAAELAAKFNAVSADHLLQISDRGIAALRQAGTIATVLPGTSYFLRMPYAPARKLIDSGLPVALATDCNPGSSFTENMQLMLSMACTQMQMTVEEALTAATLNGAAAVDVAETLGSLEVGKAANFLILDVAQAAEMIYHFGINHVREVWIRGQKVATNA